MALATYTDLLAALNGNAGWLHRNDLWTIAPDWVTLAEVTINYGDLETLGVRGLRTGDQETIDTSKVTTANVQTVALPANFLEMRKVYLTYGNTRIELQQAPVLPIRSDEMSNVASLPRSYIVVGSSLYLIPIPDAVYSLTLDYYAKVGPLATTQSGTNWLMTAAPMTYLAGAIVHGSPWLGASFNPTPWVSAFRGAMGQVARADNQKRNRLTTLRSEVAQMQNSSLNILTGT